MKCLYEVFLAGLLIAVVAAFLVWRDANGRNEENAAWWALGTLLLLVIVLPLYLYHRAYGERKRRYETTGRARRYGGVWHDCPKCRSDNIRTWPTYMTPERTEEHECLDCKHVWTT